MFSFYIFSPVKETQNITKHKHTCVTASVPQLVKDLILEFHSYDIWLWHILCASISILRKNIYIKPSLCHKIYLHKSMDVLVLFDCQNCMLTMTKLISNYIKCKGINIYKTDEFEFLWKRHPSSIFVVSPRGGHLYWNFPFNLTRFTTWISPLWTFSRLSDRAT